jgi:hypothetical protein
MSAGFFISRPSPGRVSTCGGGRTPVGRLRADGPIISRRSPLIHLHPDLADLGPGAGRFPTVEPLSGERPALAVRCSMPQEAAACVVTAVGSPR